MATEGASENKKIIYILRGLPGSGKSTLAKSLLESSNSQGIILSTDDFFMEDGVYKYDVTRILEAHRFNQNLCKENCEKGVTPVIIDNTNVKRRDAKVYIEIAVQYGYEVQVREPDTPWWKSRNIQELTQKTVHGVPEEKIQKMLERWDDDFSVETILNEDGPHYLGDIISGKYPNTKYNNRYNNNRYNKYNNNYYGNDNNDNGNYNSNNYRGGNFHGNSYRGSNNGFRGNSNGFRGGRGNFRGNSNGFRGNSNGFRGNSDGFHGGRGNFRGNGYFGGRGNFRGNSNGFRGNSDGFRGGRGSFRGNGNGYFGGRGNFRGGRGGYHNNYNNNTTYGENNTNVENTNITETTN
ncbi:hypothetical protein BCR36DRAFT_172317 [Piromyces finnis]|uniref:P-loop containing nucleoside triphosphate hydrolase protein n=1 Tax=Piromyces finnis TaxID=1754191 RepID=A0A1Y1UUR7_9FUNG|nr:hypothetical protein BCR36DRAFT_172317 [Piromyces finnis]|eukprot:ORX41761.1 hypothetical protein BCR36DRAFT_172317 [Piromyces finnis]